MAQPYGRPASGPRVASVTFVTDELLNYWGTTRGAPPDGPLPPHYPTCYGCGPDAEQGMHLSVRREGQQVRAEHVFEARHAGAPGIAHGGIVATVVDDLLGHLMHLEQVPAVTRHLEVDYLRPVLLGVPYTLVGRLDRRDGRKLWVSCTATSADGTAVFTGTGLFIQVPLEHFAQGSRGPGTAYAP